MSDAAALIDALGDCVGAPHVLTGADDRAPYISDWRGRYGGEALAVVLPASGWGGADGLVTSVSLTINNYLFAMGGGQIWKEAITVEAVATPVP
ncbi:MAG: hypothetical protein ACLGII_15420, partial [Gammaproteobacteria bacterium]